MKIGEEKRWLWTTSIWQLRNQKDITNDILMSSFKLKIRSTPKRVNENKTFLLDIENTCDNNFNVRWW